MIAGSASCNSSSWNRARDCSKRGHMPCRGLKKTRTENQEPRGRLAFRPRDGTSYLATSSPAFLRLSQLYFRWNFSTRPVVSMNFILPVKKGWQAEQISTVMFFFVLRVTNLLPQPQTTV